LQVNDGYFVHFFAPRDLKALHKHVVFVLDVSGSMDGRTIEQLKEAMTAILDDLNDGDYFNIVEFSYSVTVMTRRATEGKTFVISQHVTYMSTSRDSSVRIATLWTARVQFPQGKEIFLHSTAFRPALGPNSQGVKRPGR
jgi:hypothetical protein